MCWSIEGARPPRAVGLHHDHPKRARSATPNTVVRLGRYFGNRDEFSLDWLKSLGEPCRVSKDAPILFSPAEPNLSYHRPAEQADGDKVMNS